ncbi:MAG: LysM peptidoglycan-binding domain-containing protein [Anaerolineae bacterium]|nr:LysM peptidoglycan-binding domain-containing protein [Anaerolineae bacterium]
MQDLRRLFTVILVLAALLSFSGLVTAQDQPTTHTVQAGENLNRIARQYNTTVAAIAEVNNITNPNLIVVGQVLVIPTQIPALTPTATATANTTVTATATTGVIGTATPTVAPALTPTATSVPPSGEIVHVVQAGENLFRIALKYNLTAAVVAAYNGIANPSLIYVGQQIRIPAGGQAAAPAEAPAQASATPQPTANVSPTPLPNTATNVGFAEGVQVHLPNQDMPTVITAATGLGITWIKQQIDWALYEPSAGNINWGPIDEMIDAMDGAGVNILLTVSSAPSWARESDQEKGPPTDYQTYANFVGELAKRYNGRVDAYEIWEEPNLRREWNTPKGISAASYVEMLRLAFTAIKGADSDAIVITGGLSPTGFNDGVNAIDDRVYLRQMYTAGVTDWSDAIGAHPSGWANPPDSTCCRNNRPAVSGWDDHPSFFYKQTLEDYREIMVQNGDSGKYIWVTEFGWGSVDGLGVEPADPDALGFVTFTSMDEQSQYIIRGYQLGREYGYIGPMFLYNLNFCQVVGVLNVECYWSLLDPAGNPRPAYLAVRDMAK